MAGFVQFLLEKPNQMHNAVAKSVNLTALFPPPPRLVETHTKETVTAFNHVTVQRRLRRTSFMAFHFDRAKSFAFAGKNIMHNTDRPHGSKCGEHVLHRFFGSFRRQVSDKHFFHEVDPPGRIPEKTAAQKKNPAFRGVPESNLD
jgi:hypothetical protein